MKYRIIGLISCICLIAVAVLLPLLSEGTEVKKRYHQHIEAEEKTDSEEKADPNVLASHLPLVSIDTGGKQIPGSLEYSVTAEGEKMLTASVSLFDTYGKMNRITDSPALESSVKIRIRGHSSRYFDKKGYLIQFIDETGVSADHEVFGMDASDEWALHGPYLDKTLIRNYMIYNLGGEVMDYVPNVRFCEVFINGNYEGLYVMTETIKPGKNGARLPISMTKKQNTFGTYLLLLDRENGNPLKDLHNYTEFYNACLSIEYPGTAHLTEQLRDDIYNDFKSYESKIKNHTGKLDELIDIKSFADFFILNEMTANYDSGRFSTFIFKGTDGKLHICIWDFNNSCDNYAHDYLPRNKYDMWHRVLFNDLISYDEFGDAVIEEYKILREKFFSDEYLDSYIDDVIEYLGPAAYRNNERWHIAYEKDLLNPPERNALTYEEAVGDLKDFFTERLGWLDENVPNIKDYFASKSKK